MYWALSRRGDDWYVHTSTQLGKIEIKADEELLFDLRDLQEEITITGPIEPSQLQQWPTFTFEKDREKSPKIMLTIGGNEENKDSIIDIYVRNEKCLIINGKKSHQNEVKDFHYKTNEEEEIRQNEVGRYLVNLISDTLLTHDAIIDITPKTYISVNFYENTRESLKDFPSNLELPLYRKDRKSIKIKDLVIGDKIDICGDILTIKEIFVKQEKKILPV